MRSILVLEVVANSCRRTISIVRKSLGGILHLHVRQPAQVWGLVRVWLLVPLGVEMFALVVVEVHFSVVRT